jgi:hypothetical protein
MTQSKPGFWMIGLRNNKPPNKRSLLLKIRKRMQSLKYVRAIISETCLQGLMLLTLTPTFATKLTTTKLIKRLIRMTERR